MTNTILLVVILVFQIYLTYKVIRIDRMFEPQREADKKWEKIDELYEEAKKLVIEEGKASASFLQRRLRMGYARSAKLLDMMEEEGIVGPADGAEPREILKNKSE